MKYTVFSSLVNELGTILQMKSKTIILSFIVIVLSITFFPGNLNNACTNYLSYFNIRFSNNCFYIPDVSKDVPEIITSHTGSSEFHEVQTEDGFSLGLFRIPRRNPNGVVLFGHPIANDAKIWVAQYNESVAFLFWKAGYDVWLGNNRGTHYSKKHLHYKTIDAKFWNFSFHEMGYYDNKATIDYIKLKTNVSKIIYVGYSQSTSSGLVYASLRPEDAASSIKMMVLLSPIVAPIRWPPGPVKYFALCSCIMERIGGLFGSYSSHQHDGWLLHFIRMALRYIPFKIIPVYLVSISYGWTPDEFDPKYANMMFEKCGSEFSYKSLCHLLQLYYSQNFQMYDYGKENLQIYGKEKPPLYPIEKIAIPLLLVHSVDDFMTFSGDIEKLYRMLPDRAKVHDVIKVEGLNHMDFAFGKHRNKKVYNKILKILTNY